MTQFVHHPDYTCLAQRHAFDVEHGQLERYTFPFAGIQGDDTSIKVAVKHAVRCAMEARANRGITIGRMHVEIQTDKPWCGRVVDHVARQEQLQAAPEVEPDESSEPESQTDSSQAEPEAPKPDQSPSDSGE